MDDSNSVLDPVVYRIDLFRLPLGSGATGQPNPSDFRRRLVRIFDRSFFFVDPIRKIVVRHGEAEMKFTRVL